MMTIIAEEWLSEMKRDKATEKWHGDLNARIHEISIMWRILSLTRTTDQTQEEDLHLGEEEGGRTPETHESQSKRSILLLPVSWERA
jgi:hypothetical protein